MYEVVAPRRKLPTTASCLCGKIAIRSFAPIAMPPLPDRSPLRLALFIVADLFGVFCIVVGASWFFAGHKTLLPGFPASLVEAVACTAGGMAVMGWAVSNLLAILRPGSKKL